MVLEGVSYRPHSYKCSSCAFAWDFTGILHFPAACRAKGPPESLQAQGSGLNFKATSRSGTDFWLREN